MFSKQLFKYERGKKFFHDNLFFRKHIRYKFYNYFFILKIKNDSRSYLWRWVFSCLWSSQRIRDQCSSERIVEPQRRHPWNEERSLNSPNRIQDLEERTIKLTKSDTINPLTSSTHNCSPNFVKRVRMYVYLASSNDWNILEYRRRLELCRLHYQYDCAIWRNGYWIIYLKSLNFEIIEKVKSIMYIRLKTT